MLRRLAMKADEMQTVVREDRAALAGGNDEHLIVWKSTPGLAEQREGEHVMAEHAKACGDSVVEVFVRQQACHQAAAFSAMSRSISSRCPR